MELRQLTYFLAAAETQNFMRAAEICAVAQSNLSRQIAALEAELKVELFRRNKKRVTLSPEGREFAGYAREALERLQKGQQFVNKLQAGESGLVQLGCVQPLSTTYLPAVLSHFGRLYPGIKVKVKVGRADELKRLVEEAALDFALIFDPTTRSELLVVEELFRESLQLVVPEGHHFCQKGLEALTLSEIAPEPLILLSQPSRLRRTVDRVFAQRGIKLEPRIEVDSTEVLKELVKAGMGVTIMPPVSMKSTHGNDGLALLPISDLTEEFIFALIYRNFGVISLAARELIRTITTFFNRGVEDTASKNMH